FFYHFNLKDPDVLKSVRDMQDETSLSVYSLPQLFYGYIPDGRTPMYGEPSFYFLVAATCGLFRSHPERRLFYRNNFCGIKQVYKKMCKMENTERYFFQDEALNEERHLESGDNPEEREGAKKQKPDKDDNVDRDLESGDNPDER